MKEPFEPFMKEPFGPLMKKPFGVLMKESFELLIKETFRPLMKDPFEPLMNKSFGHLMEEPFRFNARNAIFSFSRRPEKMVFQKTLRWNMIFLVLLGKMILLLLRKYDLNPRPKMNEDLSQKNK